MRGLVGDGASEERATPGPGDWVGRYRLLAPLGAGGMGVVFEAIDPELDRRVALKLIHAAQGDEGSDRLLREARALAKLGHPNVVQVFDVGLHHGHVFVAMELIDGRTLSAWVREVKPDIETLVGAFLQAARGLSAAHRAGLVHRDFKPSNVLVDRQTRVRVLDFGLARRPGRTGRSGSDSGETRDADSFDTPITRAGTVVGTPIYMAPEQHVGGIVDTRSDQYAFCVALWEMLHGEPPFAAGSVRELAEEKFHRRVRSPAGGRVPARLVQVLSKGLDPEPDRRWVSMDALASALLGRDRRWLAPAIAGGGAATVAAIGWWWMGAEASPASCATASERVQTVWNATRREEIEAALLGTGSTLAPSVSTRIGSALDARAQRWAELHTQVCRATQVDDTRLDRRMACLDERLVELDTYVGVLASATLEDVAQAPSMVARLEPLDACLDPPTTALSPADPNAATEVAAIRRDLVVVDALIRAGRVERAAEEAETARARAERVAWAPASLEVDLRLARLDELAGKYDVAVQRLERVALGASAEGYDEVAAQAKTSLVVVTGYHLAHYEDAERWARDAEAHLQRLDDPGMTKAILLNGLGQAAERAGRFEEARLHQQASLELREELLPAGHPDIGTARLNLGNALYNLHDLERAWEAYTGALEIWEQHLGPDHPDVGMLHNNLASVAMDRGDEAAAREHIDRALAIVERTKGAAHPDVAIVMVNHADVLAASDREAAMASLRRALAIFEAAYGPDHPTVAACTSSLGSLMLDAERYAEAEPLLRRSLEIVERAFGPDHPQVAVPLLGLGVALLEQGRPGAAAHIERAVSLYERGPTDPEELAEARATLARARERER